MPTGKPFQAAADLFTDSQGTARISHQAAAGLRAQLIWWLIISACCRHNLSILSGRGTCRACKTFKQQMQLSQIIETPAVLLDRQAEAASGAEISWTGY